RRHASTHITKSASARGDGNLLARGELKKLTHISCRLCKDDNFRRMRGEPLIASMRSDRFRIVRDNFVIEKFSKLRSEFHLRGTSRTAVAGQALRRPNDRWQAKRLPYNLLVDRDAIMPGRLHSCDERFGFWKNHRLTCVWAGKFRYCIHGIEAEQRDKFHF